ncbi:MAG: alpha-galactosidase [Thermoguttaceae bacterium]|nr:alpha-galactosidase [Thermoguttaceae bacterium]
MKRTFAFALLTALLVGASVSAAFAQSGAAAPDPFDPAASELLWAPKLVDDAVMPSHAEIELVDASVDEAFSRFAFAPVKEPGPSITVERQDYAALTYGATCVGQPFDIGGEKFKYGLGTHANSRLKVFAGESPITRFTAKAGINASESAGSVQFAIEANGKEVWRSETVRGGNKPIAVDASFDPPVQEFVLVADTTDDGPSCDQANWLNPIITDAKGAHTSLCDAPTVRLVPELPFSFKYGGVSSREFLNNWEFTSVGPVASDSSTANSFFTRYTWTDPKTKLSVCATVRTFRRFAAADWVLTFTNNGDQDTPLIEDVKALDATFNFGVDIAPLSIHTLSGDSCDSKSWSPVDYELKLDETKSFAPTGGRSSNGAFPFWNVTPRMADGDEPNDGVFFAVGWSGQWNASFTRPKGPKSTLIATAGMETFASVLRPGESIRTPRALVMPWIGDRTTSQVLFRRLLMFEYAPQIAGKPVKLDFIAQCFDRYYRKLPGWEKCGAQIQSAKALKEIGGSAYWFDAAWFPLGFPNGVGNWRSDPENFPNGVEELGSELKKLGLRFVLWFEPERVARGSEIATKYPQYVFGGENGGLFKLNDPEARAFLTELLQKRIKEFQIDVYRNDFNLDPLPYWLAADEPNRKGMTETRYVEGHYEMWDAFRAANPNLWIDNCASGGRRIDLETVSRSVPLWRSDTCCWAGHPEWDQAHTMGIAQFLPLYSCSSWDSSPYTFRSAANPGAIMQYNFLDSDYDQERAKKSVDEAKLYQKFWYGDFYPLTPPSYGKSSTVAWQLHRPDLDAGVVYIFRQPESPYPAVEFKLHALDPDATYRVRVKDGYDAEEGSEYELSGEELAWRITWIQEKGSAVVLEYARE